MVEVSLRESAVGVVARLRQRGFEAYFAGGCVRDQLLGIEPKDYDIATSAAPEQIETVFRNTIGVGRAFGVMVVVVEGIPFQVATFRSDGAYVDGRHPTSVRFSTAEEDVKRRDFTINGLLYDPIGGEVLDYVGGREDIERRVIRAIGDPAERFREDHLRLLRAVRFAVRLDFKIDAATHSTMRDLAPLAATPSAERIGEELRKMLHERSPSAAVSLLDESGMLDAVLPELVAKKTRPLDTRYMLDEGSSSFRRTVDALGELTNRDHEAIAWAVLLGLSTNDGPVREGRAAEKVMRRLKFSSELMKQVVFLIGARDRGLFASSISQTRLALARAHPGSHVLRRYLDVESSNTAGAARRDFSALSRPLELPPPLLRGEELIAAGVPKGPILGRVMRRVRWRQLADKNFDKEAALAYVADTRSGFGGRE